MPTHHEITRLERVYRSYRESPAVQAQWDEANPGNQAILFERQNGIRKLLDTHGFLPLRNRKVLDVGCGTGKVLGSLLGFGAKPENLYGVDLLPDRIAEAQKSYPDLHFRCGNAESLEFQDAGFDLVLVFTVFSSILDQQMACNVAREVARVVRSGGGVLWYDFRYKNPRNPNVRGVTKRHIEILFPDFLIYLNSTTLFPPIARHLGRLTAKVYPLLAAIPLLRTHYLGLLVKRGKLRKSS